MDDLEDIIMDEQRRQWHQHKNYSILYTCRWCGLLFTKNHGNVKYCDSCKGHAEKEATRIRVREYRKRWDINNKKELGTGYYIKGHMNEDPEREAELIRKELTALGLHSKQKLPLQHINKEVLNV